MRESSHKCQICGRPSQHFCHYCGSGGTGIVFYCSDHRCAHFADQITRELKSEKSEAIEKASTCKPRDRGFPNQQYPWNRNIWKDSEKKGLESHHWFLLGVFAFLILGLIVSLAQGR